MLEIRRYQAGDYDEVWDLHILGLQRVGAYLGDGPWDNDLRHIEDAYLQNRGEFLIRITSISFVLSILSFLLALLVYLVR